ncbi:ATP-binding cassette domain-containing protein [Tomitella fengzijianii]|uniref:ATP-binding cassette domain-containing protein n=1 Tax=Tomitella fengzijianii TaxID=2597660 RepID=A0A516X1Z7_9ACTN|nr:ATP-binding cassette domain-containing protein [Tomitella fengzijianii]QDQ97073.1 ATP-binding cassette domain-containing protein [Tomitella fengzijianii]
MSAAAAVVSAAHGGAVLCVDGVAVVRQGRALVDAVSVEVHAGERWAPTAADTALAEELTATLGLTARTGTRWSVLSQGERGRVLIARALMTRPRLLLLDEPTTGLDLAAREILLDVLSGLRQAHPLLSSLLVTHHLEELPPSTTHALVLAGGKVLASGLAEEVLTSATITGAFGYPIAVERRAGRWTASSAAAGRREVFAGDEAGIVQMP